MLSQDQLEGWGWRIAFFIGGLLGLIGMWLRRSLVETEQFEENAEKARATKHPAADDQAPPEGAGPALRDHLLSTLTYYTFFSALTPFAITFRGGEDRRLRRTVHRHRAVRRALLPVRCHVGPLRRRPQLLVWSGALAVLIVPLSFVQDNLFSLIVVFCTGLGLYALMASIAPAVMSELFPTELRATGIGAWYNLTVACFGGTAPLVITACPRPATRSGSSGTPAAGAVAFLVILRA